MNLVKQMAFGLVGASLAALPLSALASAINTSRAGDISETSPVQPEPPRAPNATLTQGFEGSTTLLPAGWIARNQSSPVGTNTNCWNVFTGATPWVAHGGTNHVGANFNCTSGANTISGWLITEPLTNIRNGDTVSFWTRKGAPDNYPDRLEVRACIDTTPDSCGAAGSTGATSTDVGQFTNLIVSVNPTLITGVYPTTYTQITATVSGLASPGNGRIAFRYFVTNGGPTGANSDIISIDDVSIVAAPLSADLAITKTDGVASVNAGGTATYTITASNAGPDAATGATVADTFPAACVSPTWTCVGAGGGTCTASGSGNINDAVNLPSGGSVTYTATCPVSSGASGSLANTATVTAPGGTTDPNTANNSATDTDTINSIAAPQFTYSPAAGSAVNFTGGTLEGSTGSASIAVTIGTPGLGTGASATTTTTCVVPGGFSGFGQSVTAEGAAASTTGGPLSGSCVLGASQVVQTMTCTENQGGTPVTRTFDLTCPAGTAATLTSTPVSGSTVNLPAQIIGTGATNSAISFQNPGLVPATVTCVAPAAPFTANPLTINVPAGGSASTTVSFNSATAGVFNGTLTCSAGQQQFTFALAGTANAPSVPVPATNDYTRLLLVISALLMGMVTLGLRARRG